MKALTVLVTLVVLGIQCVMAMPAADYKGSTIIIEKSEFEDLEIHDKEVIDVARGNCRAYTTCPNGGAVSCVATGAGCTWYVQPYHYVTCTGYNPYGVWATWTQSCF